ncbi:MAG: hypothetical protein FVQ81_10740 [Candidatus Glassbacteria bacterium]|nr:hypothetical protein [Candidatus Glassbacteria bacterium]
MVVDMQDRLVDLAVEFHQLVDNLVLLTVIDQELGCADRRQQQREHDCQLGADTEYDSLLRLWQSGFIRFRGFRYR